MNLLKIASLTGIVAALTALGASGPALAGEPVVDEVALGEALALAGRKVAASVVLIETIGGLTPKEKPPPEPPGPGKKGGKKKGPGIVPRGFQQAQGPTTGVVVSSDGYILTSSYHFRRKPSHIFVTLPGGAQHVARLLGQDHTRGLALIHVKASGLSVPEYAPTAGLRVGQFVAALGKGYGDKDPSMHFGILSALRRVHGKAVQTDAKTSPVNYGGPLVDLEGRVVGIIVPLSMRGALAGVGLYDSGIGFAVPASDLPALIETLKKGVEIHPAFLGIQPDPRKASGGATIAKVVPGSAAAKAGLKPGETILALDGKPVDSFLRLFALLGALKAGDRVVLTVRASEGGAERKVEVVLGKPE